MIQNPDAQVFNLFPTALYVTNYRADTSVFTKYFDEQEMEEPNGGYGVISKNSYVIDDPICKPLADFFMKWRISRSASGGAGGLYHII